MTETTGEKRYTQIQLPAGCSLKTAVQFLISKTVLSDELFCGDFEGITLYSDTVSLNSAYEAVTGSTYYEFTKAESLDPDEKLITDLVKKGHAIISENLWSAWDDSVKTSVNGVYMGKDIMAAFEIISMLFTDHSDAGIEKACARFKLYGYNSTLNRISMHLISQYSSHGEAFVKVMMTRL